MYAIPKLQQCSLADGAKPNHRTLFGIKSHNRLFIVSKLAGGWDGWERLTQSPSFFVAGMPISSNVAGPCFFGGPDEAELFDPPPADGGTEEACESGAGEGLPCEDEIGDGLEPFPCEDMVICGGRCAARPGCWGGGIESNRSGRCCIVGVPVVGVIELPFSGRWA